MPIADKRIGVPVPLLVALADTLPELVNVLLNAPAAIPVAIILVVPVATPLLTAIAETLPLLFTVPAPDMPIMFNPAA